MSKKRPSVRPERLAEQLQCEVVTGPPRSYGPDNPSSRAVARIVMPGEVAMCACCEEPIKFRAKIPDQYMILATIVDEDGAWVKNEHYYPPSCYDAAGAPYGPVYSMSPHEGAMLGIEPAEIKETV